MLLCLVACTACASTEDRGKAPQAAESQRHGEVAFHFLPDPGRVAPRIGDNQVFRPPVPLETPLPQFPPGDEARAGAPVTVVVRIVVGEEGTVTQVIDSPLAASGGGGTDATFRAAVEAAVRGWTFVPAAICTLAPGEDLDHDAKPDYTILVDSTHVPAYLDVGFRFELVEGTGRVRLEPGS